MFSPTLFNSYFLGGFECSTHRRRDGRRLDLIASTQHDRLVVEDYRQLAKFGIRTMRDGLRWYRIETSPGRYDWSSFLPMLRAARDNGVQVIWDLCHYGWPDDINIWKPEFLERFAWFAAAAAKLIRDETDDVPFFCPVNEISYWSWAGGEVGLFSPVGRKRGAELKKQLIRASIVAIEAVRGVDPRARFISCEPLVNIVAAPDLLRDRKEAEAFRVSQFQALDALAGWLWPELGGKPEYVDIVGVNYYSDNQWILGGQTADPEQPWKTGGQTIEPGHPLYRPFRELLTEIYGRFGRPILIAETGAEFNAQADWLRYIGGEVRAAMVAGIPVEGICLYPILHYPGWEDDRHCECGLLGVVDGDNRRAVDEPLAGELRVQDAIFENLLRQVQRGAGVPVGVG